MQNRIYLHVVVQIKSMYRDQKKRKEDLHSTTCEGVLSFLFILTQKSGVHRLLKLDDPPPKCI